MINFVRTREIESVFASLLRPRGIVRAHQKHSPSIEWRRTSSRCKNSEVFLINFVRPVEAVLETNPDQRTNESPSEVPSFRVPTLFGCFPLDSLGSLQGERHESVEIQRQCIGTRHRGPGPAVARSNLLECSISIFGSLA